MTDNSTKKMQILGSALIVLFIAFLLIYYVNNDYFNFGLVVGMILSLIQVIISG